jgi:hypothetical protein
MLEERMQKTGVFLFNLSRPWVLMYNSWNAAFSYGFNYSWSTRFMLVTALLVSNVILQEPRSWLGARVLSLTLNMVFRATETTHMYKPGQSFLTQTKAHLHNPLIRSYWGFVNAVLAFLVYWFY